MHTFHLNGCYSTRSGHASREWMLYIVNKPDLCSGNSERLGYPNPNPNPNPNRFVAWQSVAAACGR